VPPARRMTKKVMVTTAKTMALDATRRRTSHVAT
jgi:hypothetical protein